jgi:hypothetical protein
MFQQALPQKSSFSHSSGPSSEGHLLSGTGISQNVMQPSNFSPCRILTYGRDEVLLRTRRAVLQTAGFQSDIAQSPREILDCISTSDRNYHILILCHSVPADEQRLIGEAAKDTGIRVYGLTTLTPPVEFLSHVQQLAHACSP